MIPNNIKYPDFVPDQLLTSDNLNQLFRYLDEQGRMTRTNLLGIGIVCGLDVKTAADGTSIKITKGTGITSEGYLVTQDDATYTEFIDFNPARETFYDKFLSGGHTKKFDLWELKQSAAVPGATPLSLSFLDGGGINDKKVVLLFVELLQEQNKNCNPESCDDKGVTINVNLRPLLIRKQDVDAFNLTDGIGSMYYNQTYANMAEMRIRRFDVAAGAVVSAAGLFSAYKKILTSKFLNDVEVLLTSAWTRFSYVVGIEYGNVNPFSSLAEKFAFLNNGSIDATQLQNIQYVYDHFSDLLAAYEEFRRTGMEVLSTCCPDSSLFPRHLLLDMAVHPVDQLHSSYRHHFLYSPLLVKKDLQGRLRSLFRRLVLMMTEFKVPAVTGSKDNPDAHIRITPSLLDASPLSSKAIPFYYVPTAPSSNPLFKNWSYERTQATDADKNLSYHAGDYSAKAFVVSPLRYDLEPYNFLRIEGHVGKPFSHVMSNLKNRIKENRLPIDVIALSLGTDASGTETDPKLLQNIQTQYEVLRSEVLCCLKRQLVYWGHLEVKDKFKYGSLNLPSSIFVQATEGFTEGRLFGRADIGTALETSRKAQLLSLTLGTFSDQSLASEYLRFQDQGDFNVSHIPAPVTAVFDTSVISHYALIILDEIEEITALLKAENLLALDIDSMETHRVTLDTTIAKLTELVTKQLDSQKAFLKIKAYVGEAQQARVAAIAEAMPDLGEENADLMVLLLLNLPEETKPILIEQLRVETGKRANQQATLNVFFRNLKREGMTVPSNQDVAVVEDPFLVEMRERLKAFNCLCTLEGFKQLRALLKKLIDELKQANLFQNFSGKHPGLQHKAGVTMGGTFIVVYHRTGGKSPDKTDTVYEKISQDLPDGMVVADFYLPYLSYSSHPPIVYQLPDIEAAPEEVELQLQPNPKTGTLQFSVGDETPYSFRHVPNNGSLTNGTPANGVTSPAADFFVFTPSQTKAALENDLKMDLTFTYVKKGVASPEVKATVFNLPTATITPTPENTELPVGSTVSFAATTQFGDKFKWTVEDAAGKIDVVATSEDLDDFPLPKEGTFKFTLQVSQSETGAVAFSNPVTIMVTKVQEGPPVKTKTCGSLAAIVEGFAKLPAVDRKQFSAFNRQVLQEIGIKPYFDKLGDIVLIGEAQQLEFFKDLLPNRSSLAVNVAAWLDELAAVILDDKRKNFRLLAIETYRLITELTLYVSCLNAGDLVKSEQQIFSNMVVHLKGRGRTKGILALPQLLPAEKGKLEQLRGEIDAEVKRQTVNREIQPKPKYETALNAVLGVLKL